MDFNFFFPCRFPRHLYIEYENSFITNIFFSFSFFFGRKKCYQGPILSFSVFRFLGVNFCSFLLIERRAM